MIVIICISFVFFLFLSFIFFYLLKFSVHVWRIQWQQQKKINECMNGKKVFVCLLELLSDAAAAVVIICFDGIYTKRLKKNELKQMQTGRYPKHQLTDVHRKIAG